MLAASVVRTDATDPLSGLVVGERPAPSPRPGWTTVTVRAAALNHHDVWALRGAAGLRAEQLPMILGTDASGVTPDGREVVVHTVIGSSIRSQTATVPDEPRSLLSEKHPGTLAEQVAVPDGNLVDKPAELGFDEAACLPTAWLTAYRMLFREARLHPGQSVLVQGSGGGLASAAISLGAAAGLTVVATGRTPSTRAWARSLGATEAVEPGTRMDRGTRLGRRVDAVLESVGAATWQHSLRSVRPGGTVVVAGVTSGDPAPALLRRVFYDELTVRGVMVGSRDELEDLLAFLVRTGLRPQVGAVVALTDVAAGLRRMIDGDVRGKVVVRPGADRP